MKPRIRKATLKNPELLNVEITGEWLMATDMVQFWRRFKGNYDLPIDRDYRDTISLKRAMELGMLK
jgi:hypothetical protein